MKSGFTQEMVAEKINVSRQTISNWENEKSYPDIISVIELSSLYWCDWIGVVFGKSWFIGSGGRAWRGQRKAAFGEFRGKWT